MNNTVFMFSDRLYNKLKWAVMILMPALSALYVGLAELWGLPGALTVSGTMALLAAFFGTLLGISTKNYNQAPTPSDGLIEYEELEQGIDLNFSTTAEMRDLIKKDQLLFEVVPKRG